LSDSDGRGGVRGEIEWLLLGPERHQCEVNCVNGGEKSPQAIDLDELDEEKVLKREVYDLGHVGCDY
jgi:hypothetical protein